MYTVLIGGEEPLDADNLTAISEAEISGGESKVQFFDVTIQATWDGEVKPGETRATVMWDDKCLFSGTVESVEQDLYMARTLSCVSDLDGLSHVLLPPHSTDGKTGTQCPHERGKYFQWLIDAYGRSGLPSISVDVNQADLISTEELEITEAKPITVADALKKLLEDGGKVDYEPSPASGGKISLYQDVHSSSKQLIDFGENLTSVTVLRSVEHLVTAVASVSDKASLADKSDTELSVIHNAGYQLINDEVLSPSAVRRYGVRDIKLESKAQTADQLAREAVAYLRSHESPEITITAKAVDMAAYRKGFDHLRAGEAVRVRLPLHDIDEYMVVKTAKLDIADPGQTEYEVGISYDTFTGQSSAYLSKLNASIDQSIDRVDMEYYLSDSPTELTGGSWTLQNLQRPRDKYLWQRPRQITKAGGVISCDPSLVTGIVDADIKVYNDKIVSEVNNKIKTLSTTVTQDMNSLTTLINSKDVSTIIREYEGGVLVAKKGQQYGALVDADGSFDVVYIDKWDGETPHVSGWVSYQDSESAAFGCGQYRLGKVTSGPVTGPSLSSKKELYISAYAGDNPSVGDPIIMLNADPSGHSTINFILGVGTAPFNYEKFQNLFYISGDRRDCLDHKKWPDYEMSAYYLSGQVVIEVARLQSTDSLIGDMGNQTELGYVKIPPQVFVHGIAFGDGGKVFGLEVETNGRVKTWSPSGSTSTKSFFGHISYPVNAWSYEWAIGH